ncbi:hypothetical protein M569_05844 [Genlisea aurea]|uniref:Uncharacterized protein n=1 Tax=Genlisea aurea TaxID=192259 RepID=S8CP58_9LAMI|nr:hypothetical protein M569_05844 [Genlisea aurea]
MSRGSGQKVQFLLLPAADQLISSSSWSSKLLISPNSYSYELVIRSAGLIPTSLSYFYSYELVISSKGPVSTPMS